jgi:hypothetical protein
MCTILWNLSASMLSIDCQMRSKWTASILWEIYLFHSKKRSFLKEARARERRLVIHLVNCSIHTSRVSIDWLEEHDIVRMSQLPYSPDLASRDFYLFSTVKEKLERIQLADENQFFSSSCKRFWVVSTTTNWIRCFGLGCTKFKKWVKGIEATSDDKKFIYIKVLCILMRRAGAYTYRSDDMIFVPGVPENSRIAAEDHCADPVDILMDSPYWRGEMLHNEPSRLGVEGETRPFWRLKRIAR